MPKTRWMLTIFCLLLAGLFCQPARASRVVLRAGSPYTITVWDSEDGLPQNSVISMIQTRDGYLWLGTLSGLARFDGERFTVFDGGNTPQLKYSPIVKLFEDTRSNLWIGTESAGVLLAREGQVTPVALPQPVDAGRTRSICEDATGAVWLYQANGQLCRYANGKAEVWNAGQDRPSKNRLVIVERSGRMWLGLDGVLFGMASPPASGITALPITDMVQVNQLDYLLASAAGGYWRLADGRIQKWNAGKLERDLGPYPWTNAPVVTACEDQEGNLVVGTSGAGVYWFDAAGKPERLSKAQGLSDDFILSLTVDREGSLWVGTDGGGLNRVRRQVFQVLEQSRDLTVQSVCAGAPDGVWYGISSGGVNYWADGKLQHFEIQQNSQNPYVRAVFVDHQQQVWVGTYLGGLYRLEAGEFKPVALPGGNPQVSAIYEDHENHLWVGTQGGLAVWDGQSWSHFATYDGLAADNIQAITEDAAGGLWVGTAAGLSWRQAGIKTFTSVSELSDASITSLATDAAGDLWVGTQGNGLFRRHAGQWTRFGAEQGLISNSIGYVMADGHGYLWIGSYRGLMRVAQKDFDEVAAHPKTQLLVCRTYGRPDGLPTGECTQGSQPTVCRTADGRLWFSTIKGLVSVDPTQIKLNTNVPPVIIESISAGGRRYGSAALRAPAPQAVVIPPGQERLEIEFTSLNLADRERTRFRYRMANHETTWTEVGGDGHVARYPKLPAGHYQFQVTACNEDGLWNPMGSTLVITVLPPFWQTWWFVTLMAGVLLALIVVVVHYFSTQKLQRQLAELRQQEALEKERSRIARDIHDQLGASLTQVALLGEFVEADKDVPAEVEAHARQISQTARDTSHALDEIVWTVNPANDTLEGLINYICKNAQDYFGVAGLHYRLEAPAQLPAVTISPELRHNVFLAAKEAVTNVVRHARAKSVWVRLRLTPEEFVLEIADDGCGPAGKGARSGRNGLLNMRKRMEDVGGSFHIGPAPEGGTVVRLTAPLKPRT